MRIAKLTGDAAKKKKNPARNLGLGFGIDAWQRLQSSGAVFAKRKKRRCGADKRVTMVTASNGQ